MAVYRRSILWRLGADPVARLWSGVGNLNIPAHPLDPAGATYRGAGALLNVPTLKQLINGVADRCEFTVSGVSAETLRLALEDRYTIRGAPLHVGYINFDKDWQVDGLPVWEWQGVADTLTTAREATDTGGQRSITLSVASANTDRSDPVLSWWTDADQRRRSPTDAIFSHVAGINAGTTRRWGPRG